MLLSSKNEMTMFWCPKFLNDEPSYRMLTVSHGARKYELEIDTIDLLNMESLSRELEKLTNVPLSQQKIIFKGKILC